ncbi:inner membrane protein [Evansella caseinilytica]|uniref:Inner membrane protein n=1 Tax=Evansella caseinilytica TaxID=1503961 RepID=A0A1H3QGT5_9BACI|nr:metal-dependent hydrolase [Evansella caseinilytica]SDZ12804.1 inner membrane protein [Evansella caseinilytica]
MDTVTHTLFGLALYGAVDKRRFTRKEKQALLVTTIIGSQIPDIDVVSQLWDTEGQYQMWHRGLTHSIFMVPVFSFLIYWFVRWIWKVKQPIYFYMAVIAVLIHSTSDLFNAWGTGYFEPFASVRITFGTIPIVDLVFWAILLTAFIISRKTTQWPKHIVYRTAWVCITFHIIIQTIQGFVIYQQYSGEYEDVALAASFVPGNFSVIAKEEEEVSIYQASLFQKDRLQYVLESEEGADLNLLFANKPEAETLYEWAPFVVIVDDDEMLGIYDPRFYRNGQSFLFEYMKRDELGEES